MPYIKVELTESQKIEARRFIKISDDFGRLTHKQLTELFEFWNATFPVPKAFTTCSPCVVDMISMLNRLTK
jgi:hypothetical protein